MSTLLVTLTGPDRPGVTSALFEALAAYDVTVLDMEQVVVRGTLVLGVLLGGRQATEVAPAVRSVGKHLGMTVSTSSGADEVDPRRRGRLHVTLIGSPLLPSAVAGDRRRRGRDAAPTSTASSACPRTRSRPSSWR